MARSNRYEKRRRRASVHRRQLYDLRSTSSETPFERRAVSPWGVKVLPQFIHFSLTNTKRSILTKRRGLCHFRPARRELDQPVGPEGP